MSIDVLVVDDSADVRLLLTLSLAGDERIRIVGEAADGSEAVERAAELNPHVIVLDLMMPVMDGRTAIPLLHERAPGSRILAFSGQPVEVGRDVVRECADAYVEKGASPREMGDLIVEVAGASRKAVGVRILRP